MKIILGYKMLLVLEKEVISSSPSVKKAEATIAKNSQRPPTASSVHSNHSSHPSPKVAENDALAKGLLAA